MSMMKRLLTILSICVLCITAQAQIVIGVTRTGQVGTADQNLEFVDQFGRIMAYPSLGPTGELLDAMRPAVATNLNVSDVTKVSATTGGKVIAEGASAVTECGVCFSTSTNPTTQDAHVTATPDADGNFTVSLTGLQPNTTYHVRAYATNAIGTSYGTDFTFTTRGDANITITGNTDTKTYNGAQQSVTGYTVSIPDGVNINENEISYSGNAIAQHRIAGTWPMNLNANNFSCSNTNYDVTFQVTDGYLTITPAAATVKADDKTKVAGESDPQFTATVTGLKRNDQPSVLNYSLSRATGETVGTYAITPTGADTQGNYTVTYQTGTLTITEPACPTLGTTTYTPDPVTSSATAITLTTPVNDVAAGATVTNPQYTVQVGNTTSTVTGTYSNGTMTGTITITSAIRGSAITVTPSITTTGCSNPGTVTGQAVEICVQPTLPSFGTVSNTDGSGKANLFKRQGVYTYVTINNEANVQIQEVGFYISKVKSEVQNHTCSPIVANFSKVDVHNYQGASSAFDNPEYTSENVYNTKVGMINCGVKTYYQPYMIVEMCGESVTIYGNDIKEFSMWAPEDENNYSLFTPTVSATPNPITSGVSVTLTASSWITIGSLAGGHQTIPDAFSEYSWALSMLGASGIDVNNWTYRWEDENGQTIHSSHTSGTTTVNPTQTTTYTAYGEFTYGGEVCRVSKSVTVTVTP